MSRSGLRLADPEPPSRRALLTRSLALAATAAAPLDARPGAPVGPMRNVRDFGAAGDGKTDDTDAFNRATRADSAWSADHPGAIHVPAGRYRVQGSVYVRKGQSLAGDGLSTVIDASGARASTFVMGRRRTGAGRGEPDPGGLPIRVERLFGLGGAPDQGFVFAALPGFQIAGLFLSAVGTGIEIEGGADGIISDVAIDQCLTGIRATRSQNLVFANLNMYLANYGIELAGDVRDVVIANSLFCYTRYCALLLSAQRIEALTLTGSSFTQSTQWPTFEAFIHNRASEVSAAVVGCTFRNWSGVAIQHGLGTDVDWRFDACTFDGRRTFPEYQPGENGSLIHTSVGHYRFADCDVRAIGGPLARVRRDLGSLTFAGGSVRDAPAARLQMEPGAAAPIRIRDVDGFARVGTADSAARLALPRVEGLSWRIAASGNGQAGEWLASLPAGAAAPTLRPLWSTAPEPPRATLTAGELILTFPAAFGASPATSVATFP